MTQYPTKTGFYGSFGGQFVPETLMYAVKQLETVYREAQTDASFQAELQEYLQEYVGRETPLYHAQRLSQHLGGAKIYLKREDLNHTGAHKINNALGQVLLAKRMGKKKVVAETGAGQHGVATATAAALFGMECTIFMGAVDVQRQALNVYWVATVEDTHYVMGSVLGPHPFPEIVRDFQSVIGSETRRQLLEKEGQLPTTVVACVGGGSNAMGMFYPFINDQTVRLIGVEAAGKGVDTTEHAATLTKGSIGILHGTKMHLLQDDDGQVIEPYSISAGLDYPGVGPEHSYLKEIARAEYFAVTDEEAVDAFYLLSQIEGIIPALESAHAVAYALKLAPTMTAEERLVICLSGRGDKDVQQIKDRKGEAK